jgi:hypothetical protein
MTLRLTPDILAAGYSFLRECQPFKGWRLPEADDIGFCVVRDPKIHADFGVENGVPIIRVSENGAGHTSTLLAALSHELIHLRQHLRGDRETHGRPRFQKAAARICQIHGWDLKTF